jgi:hypothetical protein
MTAPIRADLYCALSATELAVSPLWRNWGLSRLGLGAKLDRCGVLRPSQSTADEEEDD